MIFTIIVPVYNEEETLLNALKQLDILKFQNYKKEIIIVDDGSTDDTKKILQENDNFYDKLLTNSSNQGKGSAVKLGLENSTGDYIVFYDADLEYDTLDLLKFENVFSKFNADAIIGSRFSFDKYTRSHSILNKIANFLLTFVFNIFYNTTFTDIYSCYFAFKKDLLDPSTLKTKGFEQHAELIIKVIKKGSKFYEVPINYNGRNYSEGKKIRFYHFLPVLFQIFIGRFK
jgi:glycosyltransferase involved in cell wall biosynthesis